MRIAQVVPIWERVPPPKYGGTQRVAYDLTEGLVKAGHNVTLFASGDSRTSAKLVSIYPRPLYRDNISWENHLYPTLNYIEAFNRAKDFDVIHCHIDRHTEYLAFPLSKYIEVPVVFTLHFRLPDTPDRRDRRIFLQKFKDLNYISISNSQRKPLPELNFIATVYNGIDISQFDFQRVPGENLVWLGRFSRSKGPKEAIEIALKSGKNLIMAGKLDKLDEEDFAYYKSEIEPKIDNKKIRYIGEIDNRERNKLFQKALAVINPIQWEEPFGLVPAEAMAAGVPVIAFRRGAMPEIIKDGVTGFLVDNIAEAVKAIGKIGQIDRFACRKHIEEKFSVEKMVDNYQKVYKKVLEKK